MADSHYHKFQNLKSKSIHFDKNWLIYIKQFFKKHSYKITLINKTYWGTVKNYGKLVVFFSSNYIIIFKSPLKTSKKVTKTKNVLRN